MAGKGQFGVAVNGREALSSAHVSVVFLVLLGIILATGKSRNLFGRQFAEFPAGMRSCFSPGIASRVERKSLDAIRAASRPDVGGTGFEPVTSTV
jgi:hypothetical protein